MRAVAVCVLKALWHGNSHTPVRWFSLRASGSGPVKANSKKRGGKYSRSQTGWKSLQEALGAQPLSIEGVSTCQVDGALTNLT